MKQGQVVELDDTSRDTVQRLLSSGPSTRLVQIGSG